MGEPVVLAGSVFDDRGRAIARRSLTWFAGRKSLGHGARLRTRLPRGTRSLRLVARDRNGITGTARVAVRVTVPRLRLVSADLPLRVGRGARSMRVRIRVSAPAVLTAGGRRYRLGRSARRVAVRLPRRPAVGVLSIPFTISPRSGAATGIVRANFFVPRG